MRSFILLIVIALLALIGKTIPIKLLNDLVPQKSFAEVLTEAQSETLQAVKAEDLMNGDVSKVVLDSIKEGADAISDFIKEKKLTDNLKEVSKWMDRLSFAMPIVSIAMDLIFGKQTDPMLSVISDKIDKLQTRIDDYH